MPVTRSRARVAAFLVLALAPACGDDAAKPDDTATTDTSATETVDTATPDTTPDTTTDAEPETSPTDAATELPEDAAPDVPEVIAQAEVFVHPDGTPGAAGTALDPLDTIQAAVDRAAGFDGAHVKVAAGTYAPFTIVAGVEVEGGYSPTDWATHDPELHPTIVQDPATSGDANAAVRCATPVPVAQYGTTEIASLTVRGGGGKVAAGVHIFGGCALRIVDCDVAGGVATERSYGIRVELGTGTALRNDVTGGVAPETWGVSVTDGGSLQINRNVISGGSATTNGTGVLMSSSAMTVINDNSISAGNVTGVEFAHGLIVEGGFAGVVNNNVIDGGTGAINPRGALLRGPTPVDFRDNRVTGATSGGSVLGVFLVEVPAEARVRNNTISAGAGANPRGIAARNTRAAITGNVVDGGVGSASAFGIELYANDVGGPVVHGNRVFGGTSPVTAVGLSFFGSDGTAYNNMIYSGEGGANSFGILTNADSDAVVRNNTIVAGATSDCIGIRVGVDAAPLIENNLIVGAATTAFSRGIWEADGGEPAAVRHNAIVGFTAAYYDLDAGCGGGSACSVAQLNALAFPSGGGGNVDTAPVYVDVDGADEDLTTMGDNDWRFVVQASTCALREGGLDGVAAGFGFTADLLGATRTAAVACGPGNGGGGWSIGALESD